MLRLLGQLLVNAAALLATTVVPGIRFEGGALTLLVSGAIFALFNAIVRPLLLLLSLPLLVLTLGLFYVIVNGLLLWLASLVLPGYQVAGLLAGVLGSLVLGLVNWALSTLHPARRRR